MQNYAKYLSNYTLNTQNLLKIMPMLSKTQANAAKHEKNLLVKSFNIYTKLCKEDAKKAQFLKKCAESMQT